MPLDDDSWLTAGRDGTLRGWRHGHPDGRLQVEDEDVSWCVVRMPDGDLIVSSRANSYLRYLVPPRLAIQEAYLRLRDLPELQEPQSGAERSAARVCQAASR